MKRYALIGAAYNQAEVEAYLPGNYRVVHEIPGRYGHPLPGFVIEGEDNAGWTLDGYVLPRLASGLIFGHEIDLSHEIMKEVPA